MISFHIHPEPTHVNAPDAWAVWQTTTNDNEIGAGDVECIVHGLPLSEALEEISWAVERHDNG